MFTAEERLLWIYTFLKFKDKPILLDFWQDKFIQSNSRFIAVVKSRQVGYSFISSMKAFAKLIDPARKGYTCQFVSYNESDAEEKMCKCSISERLPGTKRNRESGNTFDCGRNKNW